MKSLMVTMLLAMVCWGCRHEAKPPESAYDPELLKMAEEAAAEREREARQTPKEPEVQPKKGECSREEGGCPPGYLCWDSYFCKQDFPDQCSADGDLRCHKLCSDDGDCPRSAPTCITKPIFSGSEQGQEYKFCVEK